MMVSLNIVAIIFATWTGITIKAAFWISGVNDRLSAIEKKIGIASPSSGVIDTAEAAGR